MKKNRVKPIIAFIAVMIVSCNEPETVVTNYVHRDGSVTRKIEMRSKERDVNKRFKISDIQVPLDSTWIIKDSCIVSEKGDTTWIRNAEKQFKNIEEINLAYKSDSGANKGILRNAGFKRTFKWFNTEYRFFERIEKKLSFGYPVKDFLNDEELLYFYSPESLTGEKENGPDSLKYRALSDSVKHKTDFWSMKNIVSGWIGDFSNLTKGRSGNGLSIEALKAREDEFVKIAEANDKKFDSLWSNGIILKEFIGEDNALKFKTEADSALSIATKNYLIDFSNYSVRVVMPGKLIGTNGFIDSSKVLLWPVKADYFLTEPYEMWAESKTPNVWAWIVSGFFLAFVVSGVILRLIKKG